MSAPIFVVRLLPTFDASSAGPSAVDQVEWALFQDGEQQGQIGRGTLGIIGRAFHAMNVPTSARIIVLVPAEHVVLTRVNIPTSQRRHRNRVAPFVLEEYLNQNMSEVFFATQWLHHTHDVGVAYTSREILDRWLVLLADQGLSADAVYPEHYLLPHQEDHIFVLFDEDKVLFRHDDWSASCSSLNMSPQWLESLVTHRAIEIMKQVSPEKAAAPTEEAKDEAESDEPITNEMVRVRLIFDSANQAAQTTSKACEEMLKNLDFDVNVSCKRMLLKQSVTHILATEATRLVLEHHPFQLLQGDYKTHRRKRESRFPWRSAAALFCGLLAAHLAYVSTDYLTHEQAYLESREDNVKTFKKTFPNVKRIRGTLKRAMQSQMAKTSNTGTEAEFLVLLNSAGSSMHQANGLRIDRLVFDASQSSLRVDLEVKDYPDLENIKQGLEAKNLNVKIDGANKEKSSVKARLRISAAV